MDSHFSFLRRRDGMQRVHRPRAQLRHPRRGLLPRRGAARGQERLQLARDLDALQLLLLAGDDGGPGQRQLRLEVKEDHFERFGIFRNWLRCRKSFYVFLLAIFSSY